MPIDPGTSLEVRGRVTPSAPRSPGPQQHEERKAVNVSWFRVDDQMPWHPKLMRAGGDAGWLWVCGGCWIAAHGTDGLIPRAAIPMLSDRKSPLRLAERLIDVGLWEDRGEDVYMHDYLDWNPTAVEVAERRAKRAAAGRVGGKQSGKVRRSKAASKPEANGEANASASAEANGKQKRTPSPYPIEEPKGSSRTKEPRGYTKAERDPIFSALVDVFGPASTATSRSFYGKSVTELLDIPATADEVRARGAVLKAKGWPDCTPAALLKHWDKLDPASANGNGSNGRRARMDWEALERFR